MAYDFLAMKTRIALDLDRTDMGTEIDNAVKDAIFELSSKRTFFNQSSNFTISTVADQADYAIASWALTNPTTFDTFIEIDYVWLETNGNTYQLSKANDEYLREVQNVTPVTGRPFAYTFYDEQFTLYPVPDGVYTLRCQAHFRLTELSADADINQWVNQHRNLTRVAAKQLIFIEVLKSPNDAALLEPLFQKFEHRLDAETDKKTGLGRVRPTRF